MSVAHLHNEIRKQALIALKGVAKDRLATVTSYDPGSYSVKATIQPEGFETGWIPIKSPWVGNGWGLFCPPPIGTQIEISFQEGSHEAGTAGDGLFSDEDRPLPVPAGEFWLVHQSGAYLKLTNDGGIQSNGSWDHTGSMTTSGNSVPGTGASGTFSTPTGQTVTVRDGIITNIF